MQAILKKIYIIDFLCTFVHNNTMQKLTKKQYQFFSSLKEKYSSLALPSYEKIASALGYKSKNSIRQYIETLKRENLIVSKEGFLYISDSESGANLISS